MTSLSLLRNLSVTFLLFILLMAGCPEVHAQVPQFVFAKNYGGTGYDAGMAVAVDASGNVYTTGYYAGTADFDPGPGTFNLTAVANNDLFITKSDANGNLIWARSMGGTANELGYGIALDNSGNVYATGSFQGTADFDPGASVFNLVGTGASTAFVLKLDAGGNLVWAKSFGTSNDISGRGISLDNSGNIYTTGPFNGTVDFDPGAGAANFTAAGYDAFVSKLDTDGNYLWAKAFTGSGDEAGLGIATDATGNPYITGSFELTADFDPAATTFNLTSAGSKDLFVAKLDASGNFAWAGRAGSNAIDQGNAIAFNGGSVVVTGRFTGTVDFDPGAGITNLSTSTPLVVGAFAFKLDANGNFMWAANFGDTAEGLDIAADATGNVFVIGFFQGSIDADPSAATYILNNHGNSDDFIIALDASGNFSWAYAIGGPGGDNGYGIALNTSGEIYATGLFSGTADFDPSLCVTNLTAPSNPAYDIFLIKFGTSAIPSCFLTFTPTSGPVGSTITLNGIFNAALASNIVYFGSTRAVITGGSTTQLTVTVPRGATYAPISVTYSGNTFYSSKPFLVTFADGGTIDACSFTAPLAIGTGNGGVGVALGDLDGDGKADVVVTDVASSMVRIFKNTSTIGTVNASSFATSVDLGVGSSPYYGVVMNDIDGDGKLDIVVASYNSAIITIYRNTSTPGSLSFGARLDLATGSGPYNVSCADLDGDGKTDVAVGNAGAGTISIWQNVGVPGSITAGSFNSRLDVAGPSNGFTIADLDGDNKPDLIGGYNLGSAIGVSRNISNPGTLTTGSFGPFYNFTVGTWPENIVVGDLDADNRPDIVTSSWPGNTISILKNTTTGFIGAGSFAAAVNITGNGEPRGVVITDLDGDGFPDIALSNQTGAVSIYKNANTPGSITAASFLPKVNFAGTGNARGVSSGDIDGDGKPELVVATYGSPSLMILRNTVSSLPPPTIASFSPGGGLAGTPITITGTNFSATPTNNTVKFNGTTATVTASTSTTVAALVPPAATAGPISVTVGCNTASSSANFLPGLSVTGFAPLSGPVGTTVTITGTNFDVTPTNNAVWFGATRATVTGATSTQLTVTVPFGATYRPITVTVGGLTGTSRFPFDVTFPNGNSIDPCSFAPKIDYTTTAGPLNVAIGDIDGDGKPDLITANSSTNTFSVFSNTTTPGSITATSFATKTDFATGLFANDVAIGDVDGDGKLDVVIVAAGGNGLAVHRNTSTPGVISFASRVDLSAGVNCRRVAIGDLDGDGKPELAVPNGFAVVSVFRNLCTPGTINFAAKFDVPAAGVGVSPFAIEIGDVDGDGKSDMLVSTSSPSNVISLMRNTSTLGAIDASSFQPPVNFSTGTFTASDIILTDLDGDSKPDVVVPIFSPISNSLAIFQNISTPGTIDATSLAARVDYLMGTAAEIPYSAVVSDLDGDNKPDIAVSRGQSTTLVTFRNVSTTGTINAGSFIQQNFPTGPLLITQYSINAGDLDSDGKPELVITNNKLSVLRNLITPPGPPTIASFTPSAGISGTAVTITGTNFDATPANNVVTFNGVAAIVTGSTATTLTTTVPAGASTGLIHLTIGCYSVFSATNFNVLPVITSFSPADGPVGTSVIITGSGFSPVSINNKVYFGGGKAVVTAATTTQLTVTVPQGTTYSAISVTVGGLTALTSTPFILTFPDGGVVNSCSFAPRVNYNSGTAPHDVAVGDIDGDGRPDAVAVNSADNTISVYRNTGTTGSIDAATLSAKADFPAGNTPVGVLLADIDGDGKLDVVVSNYSSDNLYFFRNTSTVGSITPGSLAAAVVLPTGAAPTYMAIRDLDGDGKADIAVACSVGGFIAVFRNTNTVGSISAAAFGTSVNFLTSNSDQSVVAEDMDGDGKPELIASHYNNATVSIYKNQSVPGSITAGSFQSPVAFAAGGGANRVRVGDLNHDGKPDVVTANQTGNSISILKNTTTPGVINSSSLAAKVDFATGTTPWVVSIGDVDGDSWPDLVAANQLSGNVSVIRNIGTGNIDASAFAVKEDFATGSDTRAAAIADMDGDGKPDLIAPNGGSTRIGILRNRVSSLPAMTATGYSPGSGPIGTVVTITGTNFSTTPINNTVKFNGITAVVTASTSTSITTSVPLGATTGPISIDVGCGTATTIVPFNVTGHCISNAERNALIAIYNATNGDDWTNKNNWLSADESTWFGVTISGCAVTKLILPLNNLNGNIPPEIQDLPGLIELDLSHNSLIGTLPPEIGNLPNLEKLLLNINTMDSELPPEIGLLSSLQILNLSNNSFSLALPPELGDLTALTTLNLSSNIFDDAIPVELGNLVNLVELDLSHNGLTGAVPPSFGNLLQLKNLIMNDNVLVIVDNAVGPLPALEIIHLENNGILSVVPPFTSANITHLSVENNNLDFSDLEPNIGVAGYTYIPQNRLLPGGVLYFNVGATLTIPFTTGGTANSYQWYLGGAIVPGATASTLVKPGMTFNDAGFYTLHITSAVVPGLTLVTENYQVMALTDPCASVTRTSGAIDASFNPLVDLPTFFLAVKLQSTGKIVVSVAATTVNSVAVDGIARFNSDGTLDNSFTQHAYYPGTELLVVQPDDKILTTWNDTFGQVVRYNADGTDDVSFNSNSPQYNSASVQAIAVQPDNKILIAHTLDLSTPTINRINADGTPDGSFSAPADISASVLRVQSDGKILASLDRDIVRLLPSGAIDPGFNVDVDEYVTDMVVQPDGKILITGFFAFVNGVPHFNVARLNADGSTDITFNPIGITDDREDFHAPYKIALQPDGKILIAGNFTDWNGYLRESIVRINADGSTDCLFDSGSGANLDVYDMILQADGQILITGSFDHYDGAPRNGLARIINTLAAPTITINPQPTDASVCDGATATFTTGATGTTNITYQWQFATISAGPYNDISNGGGYSGVTTPTLSINTTGNFGAGRYRCKISGDLVTPVFTNDEGLFINGVPTAPTTTGASSCGPASVSLIAAGGTNGQYRWYTALTGGTAIAGEVNDTYVTAILSTATTYYVTIKNGTCESTPRTSAVATINSLPTSPSATNGSNCGSSAVLLGATGGVNGQYRWYTALTGGTAIAGEVNSSYTTPVIGATTTYYITIHNGTCESAPRIPVVATINTIPAAPASSPGSNCGPGAVVLGASGGVNGQYRWYVALTGGSALAGEVNSTYTTPTIATSTPYYVTINNGFCESTPRTSVVATINPLPTAPGGTPNSRCGTGTVILGATGGVNGQYRWYTSLTGGTAIAGEVNSNYTTPSISATATYFVTIDNGTCESAPRTAVIATINTVAKPVVVTSNCTATSATLTGPNGFTGYAWSNGAITQQIIVTTAGTYTLVVTASGCNSPPSDPIIIAPTFCNLPPVIAAASINTVVEGKVELSLASLISDPDNNLDLSSLKVFKQPTSGAVASIGPNATLIIDYKGKLFAGKDDLTLEVCDVSGACTQRVISIEVAGEIVVNNGISPNGDGQNDAWIIQYVEVLPETKENHISVYNRWGDEVFETNNYDNASRVFTGLNKNGDQLPVGTYFYKIEFASGRKTMTGYISLKR